jgi:hypothetical protein
MSVCTYKVIQKTLTHLAQPLHRDEEDVREETGCMLSGGQKHLVSMEHWTAAHRAFAVEEYFENNESMVKTRLLRHHFNIHRNASVPSKNAIKSWVQNIPETASVMRKRQPGRPRTVRTPENVHTVRAAVVQRPRRSA